MKYFLLLLFFCACKSSQPGITIQIIDNATVYYGVDNIISIGAENCPCRKLSLKTNNGKIEKLEPCNYLYKADSAGSTEILMYKKGIINAKLLGGRKLRVKPIFDSTNFVVKINRHKTHSHISKNELLHSLGLGAVFSSQTMNLCIKLTIVSYKAIFITKEGSISIESKNNEFNDPILKQMATLKKGDMIIFKDIMMASDDNKTIELTPYIVNVED